MGVVTHNKRLSIVSSFYRYANKQTLSCRSTRSTWLIGLATPRRRDTIYLLFRAGKNAYAENLVKVLG